MKIARYDYASQFPDLDQLTERLRDMLTRGHYVLGEEVEAFESALAEYLGCEHAIGVNSGTDALILSMKALGIGPGDEVVTQANTFHATVLAILWTGATPVLVDADLDTMGIDLDALEGACGPRTKALLPVHLYGRPTAMARIQALADERGLLVVEDAAQAIGARHAGQRAGTFGAAGCFSFHPSKNLAAAGDGGAIVCASRELADELRITRSLGQAAANHHTHIGLNSKLDALQAVVLHSKLPHLDGWNQSRRELASMYREALADLPLAFQHDDPADEHAYHLFQVRVERRDALVEHLKARGVDATVRYPVPIHRQPAFADLPLAQGSFPVAERLCNELLTLPLRPNMPAEEVAYAADQVREFFSANG